MPEPLMNNATPSKRRVSKENRLSTKYILEVRTLNRAIV
ncbi:hypothetical protein SM11_chr1726 [Sinorhizobium meliloti SM11]|uniref:Uncharacterized protein n=1 Tax=Sinorhizobium meliloti (strain SM11) TaxID=707241 RepID=F7X8S7_SINMM|nr:hypothetical protein SM11_chr1726 [Sinorhizobium meliloti SM11]